MTFISSNKKSVLFAIGPILFLGVFYFFPLAKIFHLSFAPSDLWSPLQIKKFFATSYYLKILWFTTWQAAASTVLTLALGLPGAYLMARYRFRGKSLLLAFTTVPFVLPTLVVASAFQALLGPKGIANTWIMAITGLTAYPIQINHTIWFILLAHLFFNYTVVVRIVGGFWSHIEPTLGEAARMLGASGWQAFYRVSLPLLKPAITAAGLLVFVFCFSSFGVIMVLGGPRFTTIEIEIYRQAVHLFNLPMAAALSIIQIAITFAIMRIYTRLQRRSAVTLNPVGQASGQRTLLHRGDKILLALNLIFILGFLGAPLLALMLRSFTTDSGLSLDYYFALFANRSQSIFFVPPIEAITNSLGFAAATLMMALALGIPAAIYLNVSPKRWASWLDPLFMLPLSTSAVTLGFGFVIALDKPPLNLRTSLLLVPLAHTLVAFPFVIRTLLPAMRSIPQRLKDAAALLGASPSQVWRKVDLPILGRALLAAAIFAFSISLGEFGATVFTARPQTSTMPLAIYRFLGQPGSLNYGQAMAMSTLLMLTTAGGFFILERLRTQTMGEF